MYKWPILTKLNYNIYKSKYLIDPMEISKDSKLKLLNDKLNALMQKKGISMPTKPVLSEKIEDKQVDKE